MLTIFNRSELLCTLDMQRQAEVTQILAQNHIQYKLKVTNLRSASPISAGSRSRTGTFGENLKYQYEYKIYVLKSDAEKASYLIRK